MWPFRICGFFLSLFLAGCMQERINSGNELFQLISSEKTNITFFNKIKENDSVNIHTYEYLYNGGGVGILDVNNDGLSDIFFTGSQVPNALYLNKGNLKFKDISKSAGIELSNDWSTGVSVIDINADGFDDIYVCTGGMGNKDIFPNRLFINQGDMTFVESAKEYGLADKGESIQSVFFDYDKDGDLDMYLLTGGGFEKSAIMVRPILEEGQSRNTDRLYENTYDSTLGHPVFKNVSEEAGILIEGFGLGVSILDANQDTWPDVFVSNDYLSRDLLYINNKDGTFTDQSLEYFKHTTHFSMGNDVGDINNDGFMDIVALDMLPEDLTRRKLMFDPNEYDRFYRAVRRGYGYQYMRNMLHLNHGNNGFSEIGQLAGIHQTDWSWAPLLADFNNDGYQDIYITNGFGKDVTDLDFVNYRRDATSSPFASRRGRMGENYLDSIEQRPSITLPNYIFRNEQDLTFSDQSMNWGITQPSISNGAAYADLDNDGDLEIVVNNIDQEAFIYKNLLVERDSVSANFLKVNLQGPVSNTSGIGATVCIYVDGTTQYRYQKLVSGFQSTVTQTIHFGLGQHKKVDSLIVRWPDGKKNLIYDQTANAEIAVDYEDALEGRSRDDIDKKYFTKYESIDFTHKEREFNDFRTQPTLLHGFSNQGPGMAVGDVNGDNLDDIFIGGAYGSAGSLFIQSANGRFEERSIPTEEYEDLGAIFFDADGDDDLDLYVASGGSERYFGHSNYQDRLYFNDGAGNFDLDNSALPSMLTSTAIVTAGDYDKDGDLDLFVGGRVRPGEYPKSPESYILENQSGQFKDATEKVNPSIRNIGMMTSAVWTDFNNDTQLDLVLAGEFMRITLFKNEAGQLIDITDKTSLTNSNGMWNSLLPGDFDNDGDIDFVAGNLGLNNPFDISPENPLEIHYADFDQNGSVDPIFSHYEDGKYYPFASLDKLTKQIPILKKHIPTYREYANTTTSDLLALTGDKAYQTLRCNELASSFIENLGNDQFAISALPIRAQFAPVNGIVAEDVNLDGLLDLICVGNNYNQEVVHGRYDASTGTVLINQGKNIFKPMDPSQTEFQVMGNAKSIARLELSDNRSVLMATQNDGELKAYTLDAYNNFDRIQLTQSEAYAMVTLSDGSIRKMEFPRGASYLSQSSKSIVVTPQISKVELFDALGKSTRILGGDGSAIQ